MNNIKRTVSRLQWRVVPIIFAGILLFLLCRFQNLVKDVFLIF